MPAPVVFTDTKKKDSYRIPATPGVQYTVNGKVVKEGTYGVKRSQTVTVTAVATEWYFIAPGAVASWEHTFSTRK